MQRRLITFFMAMSLLLSAAVCVLWARSYWVTDAAGFTRQMPAPASRIVWSTRGFLTYQQLTHPAGSKAVYHAPGWVYERGPAQAPNDLGGNSRRFLGVAYADNTSIRGPLAGTRQVAVQAPYWILLPATGALPIARLLLSGRRRRAARAAAGLCVICGYDLRATPGRCPECGAVQGDRYSAHLQQRVGR